MNKIRKFQLEDQLENNSMTLKNTKIKCEQCRGHGKYYLENKFFNCVEGFICIDCNGTGYINNE